MWLCGLLRIRKSCKKKDVSKGRHALYQIAPASDLSSPHHTNVASGVLWDPAALLVVLEHLPHPVSLFILETGEVVLQSAPSRQVWGNVVGRDGLLASLFRLSDEETMEEAFRQLNETGTWRGLLQVQPLSTSPQDAGEVNFSRVSALTPGGAKAPAADTTSGYALRAAALQQTPPPPFHASASATEAVTLGVLTPAPSARLMIPSSASDPPPPAVAATSGGPSRAQSDVLGTYCQSLQPSRTPTTDDHSSQGVARYVPDDATPQRSLSAIPCRMWCLAPTSSPNLTAPLPSGGPVTPADAAAAQPVRGRSSGLGSDGAVSVSASRRLSRVTSALQWGGGSGGGAGAGGAGAGAGGSPAHHRYDVLRAALSRAASGTGAHDCVGSTASTAHLLPGRAAEDTLRDDSLPIAASAPHRALATATGSLSRISPPSVASSSSRLRSISRERAAAAAAAVVHVDSPVPGRGLQTPSTPFGAAAAAAAAAPGPPAGGAPAAAALPPQSDQQLALLQGLSTSAWATMLAAPRGGRRPPQRTSSVQMFRIVPPPAAGQGGSGGGGGGRCQAFAAPRSAMGCTDGEAEGRLEVEAGAAGAGAGVAGAGAGIPGHQVGVSSTAELHPDVVRGGRQLGPYHRSFVRRRHSSIDVSRFIFPEEVLEGGVEVADLSATAAATAAGVEPAGHGRVVLGVRQSPTGTQTRCKSSIVASSLSGTGEVAEAAAGEACSYISGRTPPRPSTPSLSGGAVMARILNITLATVGPRASRPVGAQAARTPNTTASLPHCGGPSDTPMAAPAVAAAAAADGGGAAAATTTTATTSTNPLPSVDIYGDSNLILLRPASTFGGSADLGVGGGPRQQPASAAAAAEAAAAAPGMVPEAAAVLVSPTAAARQPQGPSAFGEQEPEVGSEEGVLVTATDVGLQLRAQPAAVAAEDAEQGTRSGGGGAAAAVGGARGQPGAAPAGGGTDGAVHQVETFGAAAAGPYDPYDPQAAEPLDPQQLLLASLDLRPNPGRGGGQATGDSETAVLQRQVFDASSTPASVGSPASSYSRPRNPPGSISSGRRPSSYSLSRAGGLALASAQPLAQQLASYRGGGGGAAAAALTPASLPGCSTGECDGCSPAGGGGGAAEPHTAVDAVDAEDGPAAAAAAAAAAGRVVRVLPPQPPPRSGGGGGGAPGAADAEAQALFAAGPLEQSLTLTFAENAQQRVRSGDGSGGGREERASRACGGPPARYDADAGGVWSTAEAEAESAEAATSVTPTPQQQTAQKLQRLQQLPTAQLLHEERQQTEQHHHQRRQPDPAFSSRGIVSEPMPGGPGGGGAAAAARTHPVQLTNHHNHRRNGGGDGDGNGCGGRSHSSGSGSQHPPTGSDTPPEAADAGGRRKAPWRVHSGQLPQSKLGAPQPRIPSSLLLREYDSAGGPSLGEAAEAEAEVDVASLPQTTPPPVASSGAAPPEERASPSAAAERRSRRRSSSGSSRRSQPDVSYDGEPQWHEVMLTRFMHPQLGREVVLVVQNDVSARIWAERQLVRVVEAEHALLENIFPHHVIQHIATTAAKAEGRRARGGSERSTPDPAAVNGAVLALLNARLSATSAAAILADSAVAAGAAGAAAAPSARKQLQSQPQAALSSQQPQPQPQPDKLPAIRGSTFLHLATSHRAVTVLFCDIQGFTPMCNEVRPVVVMAFLNDLFTRLDALLDSFGVYKVETIGDCYVAAGGLMKVDEETGAVTVRSDDVDPVHAHRTVQFAKALLRAASAVRLPTSGQPVRLRVGIHSGPAMSGVVGTRMPRFCLFGDTMNTASRMESTGVPGAIHVSQATRDLVPDEAWEPTGGVQVKGKGAMNTYLLRP